jgi:hypothetical protein
MMTILLIFGLMPVLVFIKLTAQRRLFKHGAEQIDREQELYQQLLKSARARSQEKIDAEWELYRQRYD